MEGGYGPLDALAVHRGNTRPIEAPGRTCCGSLKLGTVQASGLIRTLQTKDRSIRLARTVFHGKRGELRQPYREGQEDQLGALGLVVNAIVLGSTLYIDAALNRLRIEGCEVRDEDVARLSPLGHEHVNMLGCYAFKLPDTSLEANRGPCRIRARRATNPTSRPLHRFSVPLHPGPHHLCRRRRWLLRAAWMAQELLLDLRRGSGRGGAAARHRRRFRDLPQGRAALGAPS